MPEDSQIMNPASQAPPQPEGSGEQGDDAAAAAIAGALEQAQTQAEQAKAAASAPAQEKEGTPVPPAYLTVEEAERRLDEIMKREQGRASQYYGNRFKEEMALIRADLDEALRPVRELTADMQRTKEESRVAMLPEDEQIAYWQKKAYAPPEPAPAKPAQQANQGVDPNARELAVAAYTALTAASINDVDVGDQRLWNGYRPDQSLGEKIAVMQRNVARLAQSRSPQNPSAPVPPKPTARPPVSTQRAPKAAPKEFSTRTELAEAALRGEVSSEDIRRFTRNGKN